MRCCLMLTDTSVVYKVNSFKAENVERIQNEWRSIADAVRRTVGLLAEFGFSGSVLTSQNATLIIAYYIYKGGDLQKSSRVFSSSPDQVLAAFRNSLREEVCTEGGDLAYRLRTTGFSFNHLLNAKLPSRKSLAVMAQEIDLFLSLKKGQDGFAVLSLLYPYLRFQDQVFHQDHIHPSSHFCPEDFAKIGLAESDQRIWLEWRDSIPNLQLLRGRENMEKNATPLVEWVRRMPDAERAAFRNVARPVLWTQLCSRCNRLKVLPPGLGRRAVS